ncbi:MAG: class II fructose-1,6-bisphosphate aldolase [Chloroflexi bacterium]|nr:class II fructose-1,6-bisphosphate aldolase [Chloroflexota bacterium]
MPLVTSKEILRKAFEEHFAVGAFNANNMEMVQAIVETANEERAPVILQVSQGAIAYAGLEYASELVKIAARLASIPVVLHLDHGTDFLQNVRCLRAGFTSLMYDGSAKPFEENVAMTKKVCEIAHAVGVPVEGELGRIGGTEDKITVSELEATMTDPEEARRFLELTAVDSLAVAVGSIHRMLSREAHLDFPRISAIRERTNIPLVLHGASGVPDDGVREAIASGICKINIATELNKRFTGALRTAVDAKPNEVDPRKFLKEAKEATKEAVREKIRLFGASGKA